MRRRNIFHKAGSRILAAALAAALCAGGLIGCGSGDGGDSAGSSGADAQAGAEGASSETSSEASTETAGADLEPVTLKLWSCSDKYSAQDEQHAGKNNNKLPLLL